MILRKRKNRKRKFFSLCSYVIVHYLSFYSRLPYNANSYNVKDIAITDFIYNAILRTMRQIIKHKNYLHLRGF